MTPHYAQFNNATFQFLNPAVDHHRGEAAAPGTGLPRLLPNQRRHLYGETA